MGLWSLVSEKLDAIHPHRLKGYAHETEISSGCNELVPFFSFTEMENFYLSLFLWVGLSFFWTLKHVFKLCCTF